MTDKYKFTEGVGPQYGFYKKPETCAGCSQEFRKNGWINSRQCKRCKRNGLIYDDEHLKDLYDGQKDQEPEDGD